jgi:hypothetical protein
MPSLPVPHGSFLERLRVERRVVSIALRLATTKETAELFGSHSFSY